jgi:hypothetical protein
MNKSYEIRWFHKGKAPPAIKHWFEKELYSREYIDDIYLITGLCSNIGIKIRNGKIEIKEQIAEKKIISLSDFAEGTMDVWHKYSFNLMPDQQDNVRSLNEWLTIHKIRKIRHINFRDNPTNLQFLQFGEGCRTELAELKVLKADWWTIIFEMYGDKEILVEVFKTATRKFLEGIEPGLLTIEKSYSYPEFISKIEPPIK